MPITYRTIGFGAMLGPMAFVSAAVGPGQGGETIQKDKDVVGKYARYFFCDVKPFQISPEMAAKMKEEQKKEPPAVEGTRLVDLDTTRSEGAPYLDFVWLWKG